MLEVSAVVF